jgi:hypothetical protein
MKAKHSDEEVLLDLSHFRGYDLHNGYEIDRIFGQKLPTANGWQIAKVSWYLPWYKPSRLLRRIMPKRKTECIEKPFMVYQKKYAEWKGDGYFEGYWHYPAIFEPYKNEILESLTFPSFDDELNEEIAALIKKTESVAIHVRRGDYVVAKNFKDICTDAYYKNAIHKAIELCERPELFVFSNDIDYCKKLFIEYKDKYTMHYVSHNSGNKSFRDMQLMSLAKINIVANSSFSWWGAWLNQREGHQTLCPPKWVNFTDSMDMVPNEWIKIAN